MDGTNYKDNDLNSHNSSHINSGESSNSVTSLASNNTNDTNEYHDGANGTRQHQHHKNNITIRHNHPHHENGYQLHGFHPDEQYHDEYNNSHNSSGTSTNSENKNTTSLSTKKPNHAKSSQNIVFIHKLYNILENKELKHLIWWSDNGKSFFIKPNEKFSKALAIYFKHTNITSFVRQLNIYGFHKVTNLNESNTTMAEKEREKPHDSTDENDSSTIKIWEFKHSAGIFKKGDPESLKLIKRRSSSRNSSTTGKKRLNFLGNHHGLNNNIPASHSNPSFETENISQAHINPSLSAEQLTVLRSHSSFSPYSSNDNIINLQNSYSTAPPGLIPNSQHMPPQNIQPIDGQVVTQSILNTTNEFMIDQFHSLNNDMIQVLNVLQNFITLQNSVTIHDNPTPTTTENFQNQYNILYHNISNLKSDLVNKYQTITTTFYEQQQQPYLVQPSLHPNMQNPPVPIAVHQLSYQSQPPPITNNNFAPQSRSLLNPTTTASSLTHPSNESMGARFYPDPRSVNLPNTHEHSKEYHTMTNSNATSDTSISLVPTSVISSQYSQVLPVLPISVPVMNPINEHHKENIQIVTNPVGITNGVIKNQNPSSNMLPAIGNSNQRSIHQSVSTNNKTHSDTQIRSTQIGSTENSNISTSLSTSTGKLATATPVQMKVNIQPYQPVEKIPETFVKQEKTFLQSTLPHVGKTLTEESSQIKNSKVYSLLNNTTSSSKIDEDDHVEKRPKL
ncbi:similar to Saccharomyces cerevisiae YOR140W SFL1 Transcriptional repressor and activator [Maudiozyma saulgeensis]|uniref:Similar to Saccharomyces cerevisiae YOR140W SFL1 Transcriptional repressor and activator n=1 Tax=Maudiozyma saulgeensis TaxID=1789683 RepID=A0A1X7QYR3_9SACH|nr:similar to Saccharomyces cerevisiae YOR140W SFL1 Transcriptional repressor and activator [Kazachstania saulgeensis]